MSPSWLADGTSQKNTSSRALFKIFLNFFFSLTTKRQARFFFVLLFFNLFKKFFFLCKKKRKTLVLGVKGPKKSFNTFWFKSHVLVLCADRTFSSPPHFLVFFFQNYLNVLKAAVANRSRLSLLNNFCFILKHGPPFYTLRSAVLLTFYPSTGKHDPPHCALSATTS